ncbi:polygalacturonase-like protein [Tanacetum coccineum]
MKKVTVPVFFSSPSSGPDRPRCKSSSLMMRIYGTLVAPSDYNGIATSDDWIRFHRVCHVTISGGTLDAQGSMLPGSIMDQTTSSRVS